MLLSLANAAIRASSRNQRSTSTACRYVDRARVPARVPRRTRSVCNRPDRNNTLSFETSRKAVYETLMAARNHPLKMIFGRTTFIAGVPRVSSYLARRRVQTRQ